MEHSWCLDRTMCSPRSRSGPRLSLRSEVRFQRDPYDISRESRASIERWSRGEMVASDGRATTARRGRVGDRSCPARIGLRSRKVVRVAAGGPLRHPLWGAAAAALPVGKQRVRLEDVGIKARQPEPLGPGCRTTLLGRLGGREAALVPRLDAEQGKQIGARPGPRELAGSPRHGSGSPTRRRTPRGPRSSGSGGATRRRSRTPTGPLEDPGPASRSTA